MNKELIMNPNQLVAFLEKPCAEFTKEDIKRSICNSPIPDGFFRSFCRDPHTFHALLFL